MNQQGTKLIKSWCCHQKFMCNVYSFPMNSNLIYGLTIHRLNIDWFTNSFSTNQLSSFPVTTILRVATAGILSYLAIGLNGLPNHINSTILNPLDFHSFGWAAASDFFPEQWVLKKHYTSWRKGELSKVVSPECFFTQKPKKAVGVPSSFSKCRSSMLGVVEEFSESTFPHWEQRRRLRRRVPCQPKTTAAAAATTAAFST